MADDRGYVEPRCLPRAGPGGIPWRGSNSSSDARETGYSGSQAKSPHTCCRVPLGGTARKKDSVTSPTVSPWGKNPSAGHQRGTHLPPASPPPQPWDIHSSGIQGHLPAPPSRRARMGLSTSCLGSPCPSVEQPGTAAALPHRPRQLCLTAMSKHHPAWSSPPHPVPSHSGSLRGERADSCSFPWGATRPRAGPERSSPEQRGHRSSAERRPQPRAGGTAGAQGGAERCLSPERPSCGWRPCLDLHPTEPAAGGPHPRTSPSRRPTGPRLAPEPPPGPVPELPCRRSEGAAGARRGLHTDTPPPTGAGGEAATRTQPPSASPGPVPAAPPRLPAAPYSRVWPHPRRRRPGVTSRRPAEVRASPPPRPFAWLRR